MAHGYRAGRCLVRGQVIQCVPAFDLCSRLNQVKCSPTDMDPFILVHNGEANAVQEIVSNGSWRGHRNGYIRRRRR